MLSLWYVFNKPILFLNANLMLTHTQYTVYLSLRQYSQLRNLSVGPISYAEENGEFSPMIICKKSYKRGDVRPSEDVYDIEAQLEIGYTFLENAQI